MFLFGNTILLLQENDHAVCNGNSPNPVYKKNHKD